MTFSSDDSMFSLPPHQAPHVLLHPFHVPPDSAVFNSAMRYVQSYAFPYRASKHYVHNQAISYVY